MAMNYKEESRKAPAEYITGATLVNDFVDSLEKEGLLPERWPERQTSPVSSSERMFRKTAETSKPINLEAEWKRQADRLIQLGFHGVLGESEESYRRSLPELFPQPESYKGRFDIPLLVDPRVSLERQHGLAGITEWFDTDQITNLTHFPDKPYTLWTHDANRYRQYTVKQAIQYFAKVAKDEVGSPQVEVTGLYLQKPEIFRAHGVDAVGSRCRGGLVPSLGTFAGRPKVVARRIGGPDRYWGALSRGKEIKLGF